ncbi:MAG: MFS transporter [Betaproteobacteria bacterium]|nr:MFS transporter [Betaproteobacteria bacterium]
MLQTTLRALRHRNFRLFISGQMCSLIGYWMQNVAQSWLLYRLTGSATLLGVLAFAGSVPILLLAPFAGLWSDRANLHRLMFATQILEMLQAAALAALALAGVIAPWHIVSLSMLLGILVAVELPVRHAYLLELVGNKADLPNAVAVTSMMANTGRLIGPALAGLMIGWVGEAGCFLLNTLSYIAVVITFLMIRVKPSTRPASHASLLQGLSEGLRYAWSSIPIRILLMLLAMTGFLATPYVALMPAFTREVLQGGAEEMGFLMGAAGLGAVAGTLYLASRRNVRGLLTVIAYAIFGAGAALALLAWSQRVWLALPLLIIIGFGILVTSVSVNMILQTIVDDDKRGRVMSLYTAAFLGIAPFGSLAAGAVADVIGVAATLTAGGLCCAAGALYLAHKRPQIRAHIRPVYSRLGILSK